MNYTSPQTMALIELLLNERQQLTNKLQYDRFNNGFRKGHTKGLTKTLCVARIKYISKQLDALMREQTPCRNKPTQLTPH